MNNQNAHFAQYPQRDIRARLMLLAAIEVLPRPGVSEISKLTGYPVSKVAAAIAALEDQFGLQITRENKVFRITSWGDILKREGVIKLSHPPQD